MSEREASGIEVEVLDLSVVAKWGEEQLRKKGDADTNLTTLTQVGAVHTPKGVFLLDNEGCMMKTALSEHNTWPVDLYRCSKLPDGSEALVHLPMGVINIVPSTLEAIPVKEKLQLENFIRVFAWRLQGNYNICLHRLRKMMQGN